MNQDEPDGNIKLLIKLCIDEELYTYESSLIILQSFNYSEKKYNLYKKILNLVFDRNDDFDPYLYEDE
jgi:hypothetical protein